MLRNENKCEGKRD